MAYDNFTYQFNAQLQQHIYVIISFRYDFDR